LNLWASILKKGCPFFLCEQLTVENVSLICNTSGE
jgi:hypothetical protein